MISEYCCSPVSPSTQRNQRRPGPMALIILYSVVMTCSFAVPTGVFAQRSDPNEYQVKATYLYNFGKYVKWPEALPLSKGNSFAVCVFGQDPFGAILDSTLAGETLDGKPVVLRRISKPPDALECRILFISSAEEKHLKEILTALNSGVLTVSDMPNFTRRGGMIQFLLDGNKVRFEVNLASVENGKLVLSSELLKVAASVRNSRVGD